MVLNNRFYLKAGFIRCIMFEHTCTHGQYNYHVLLYYFLIIIIIFYYLNVQIHEWNILIRK